MFITEMIFSNKHYYRQVDTIACLQACKDLPIESLHTSYCRTSGTYSAWWTFQKERELKAPWLYHSAVINL